MRKAAFKVVWVRFFFVPAQKLSETRSVGTTDIFFFWSHFLDFPFCLDKTHPKKKLKF